MSIYTSMDKFSMVQLRNELVRREARERDTKSGKTYYLPDDVWKEILSYKRKPISHHIENLSLSFLKILCTNVCKTVINPVSECTSSYSLEMRKNVLYRDIMKYHHNVRCIDVSIKNALHAESDGVLKVGDVFIKSYVGDWRYHDLPEPYNLFWICEVTKVNKVSYNVTRAISTLQYHWVEELNDDNKFYDDGGVLMNQRGWKEYRTLDNNRFPHNYKKTNYYDLTYDEERNPENNHHIIRAFTPI